MCQPSTNIQQKEERNRKWRQTATAEQRLGRWVASSPVRRRRWASRREQQRLVWIHVRSLRTLGTQLNTQILTARNTTDTEEHTMLRVDRKEKSVLLAWKMLLMSMRTAKFVRWRHWQVELSREGGDGGLPPRLLLCRPAIL